MHGVRRVVEDVSLEDKTKQEFEESQSIKEYQSLVAETLGLRDSLGADHAIILSRTKKLLLLNPDFMTAWNLRRLALKGLFVSSEDLEGLLKAELDFGVEAIKSNPKSYGAWYQRKWLLERIKTIKTDFDITVELLLCNKLLDLDSRNFHCWNYRWFLTESFAVSTMSEFDFTTLMIYRNFSNYSAWHRRSLLFPRLDPLLGEQGLKNAVITDLKLLRSAYYTEPKDQSCWFYLRWLLHFAQERFGPEFGQRLREEELESIGQLLAMEPTASLALSAWTWIAAQLDVPRESIVSKFKQSQIIYKNAKNYKINPAWRGAASPELAWAGPTVAVDRISQDMPPGSWVGSPCQGRNDFQSRALYLTQQYTEAKQLVEGWVQPYTELMRLEKPIGTWLLYWPGAWSIAMACHAHPQLGSFGGLNWRLLALFGVGALVMRGAGCTINDMWDQDIDCLVERTKSRPLAAARLTPQHAIIFLGVQLGVGLGILLQFNGLSIVVGAASLALVTTYPLMKRITYWPQLVLGLTFNWGALLGWIAHAGAFNPALCLPLYGAGISWTLLYDTIYALQDIKDDLKAEVKSTAILFGEHIRRWLSGFAVVAVGGWTWAGISLGMGWPYFGAVSAAGLHLAWQVASVRTDDPKDCLAKFKSNSWIGAIIFSGIMTDIALGRFSESLAKMIAFKPFL